MLAWLLAICALKRQLGRLASHWQWAVGVSLGALAGALLVAGSAGSLWLWQASADFLARQADEEFDLSVALEEREAAELQAIDSALQRVADGSYGLCLQCGTSIPTARLHAQPTATRCVDCQTRVE